MLVHQKMAFNSPVWFNVGIEAKPQCSACFINSVQDTMSSIMDLAKTEAMLFKFGSGAGSNLSTIRSSREKMTGGGTASGPVSFMKGYDAFAGVVKSGGKTRRAAKMVILDAGHPDVMEFIDSKLNEEKKAWALIEAGYDPSFTGEAYGSVYFQNANHSVRVTDEFMQSVVDDKDWTTHAVVAPHEPMGTYKARDIFRKMAEAAHVCGDPGIQYDTTINDWHTSSNTDRIHASNPCSEYMFLNDTACNLASLNLMKFVRDDGEFDAEAYRYAAKLTITAQEILVDNASYPTPRIEENSHKFRPLGLGYANLGALLMSRGLAYDSDEGRNYAATLTAIMHGEAYKQSSIVARDHGGPFAEYKVNEAPFLRVIKKHRNAAYAIPTAGVPKDLLRHATEVFDEALQLGEQYGYRNAQVTVLAPTGTIAFMMDCDTTGVEPDIALIKYKKLVGEGFLKIVNQTVPAALRKLGYGAEEVDEILAYLMEHETIEGAPHLKPQHLPVFDCAFKPANGERSIHYMGHVRMMGAIQPFISGAISKTVNMPEAATAEEIERVYLEGWKLGLKAIAVYRDNSKRSQPLSTEEVDGDSDRRRRRFRGRREAPQAARRRRRPKPDSPIGAGSPRSGRPSPTSSRSPGTRATSPWASIPTASPARSSSRWRRRVPRSRGRWTPSPRPFPWHSSTACRCATWSTSSRMSGSNRVASPATRRSRSRNRSWTTSSGGSVRASCLRTTRQRWVSSTAPRSWRMPRPPPWAPLRSRRSRRSSDRHLAAEVVAARPDAATPAVQPSPAPGGGPTPPKATADRHGRGRIPGRGLTERARGHRDQRPHERPRPTATATAPRPPAVPRPASSR